MKTNVCYQGDCLDVMKGIEDKSIDLIVTSPPYWKGFSYEAYFNSYKQYLDWSTKWLKECKRILKPNGTLYLNVINDSEITIRAFELMEIATRELMYKLHDTIIWYRYNQQPANTERQLTNQCEYVFMLRHTSDGVKLNKTDAYNNFPTMFKTKNVGNVWEIPFNSGKSSNGFGRKETESKWGHSGFPEKLSETCILLSTNENDIVLDCFAGSGTTLLSGKKLNRKFIGIELSPEYCEIIKERIGCEIIKPENPTDCLTEEFKDTGKSYGEGVADKLIELQKELKDKCPCGGKIVKLKSGVRTCEWCMTDY